VIWLGVAATLLALLALAPAGWALRRRVRVQGRTEATVALYRAQIVELNRDLAEQRIAAADHATAMLELQRRLLAASEATDRPPHAPDRGPLVLGLVLVPMLALALYLLGGRPDLPAQPLAGRIAEADKRIAETQDAVAQLRAVLATMDPKSKQAQEGEMMLGNAEASQGHFGEAAEAWRKVLTQQFDPTLAAMVADATSRAEGRISPASAALYRQALAAAPPNAPWRNEIEQRLAHLPSP
jgi:cytochrome c-type biogenesis protein CcmH